MPEGAQGEILEYEEKQFDLIDGRLPWPEGDVTWTMTLFLILRSRPHHHHQTSHLILCRLEICRPRQNIFTHTVSPTVPVG